MRREDLNRDLTQKRSALFGIIRYLAPSPSLLECHYWFWRVSVSVRSLSPFLWHGFWVGCNLYFIFPKILDVAIHSINLILINYALSNMMAFFRSSLLYILFFTSEMWVFVQYRKNIEELSDSKALANLLLIICVAIEIGLLYFFGIVSGELIPFKIKW